MLSVRWLLGLLLLLGGAWAQYDPPRIVEVMRPLNVGNQDRGALDQRRYFIDKGVESGINEGDVLNVYRDKRPRGTAGPALRIFIGTMHITASQQGSSVGRFEANAAAMAHPMIRYKIALKNDIVVPRLVIDSSVLFDKNDASLKPQAAAELQKVAAFVKNFTPSKLVIAGHTDADGDRASNQKLSEQRARAIRLLLINRYNLDAAMIEARGYGEDRPLVKNDTEENKALNRRIEVIAWE